MQSPPSGGGYLPRTSLPGALLCFPPSGACLNGVRRSLLPRHAAPEPRFLAPPAAHVTPAAALRAPRPAGTPFTPVAPLAFSPPAPHAKAAPPALASPPPRVAAPAPLASPPPRVAASPPSGALSSPATAAPSPLPAPLFRAPLQFYPLYRSLPPPAPAAPSAGPGLVNLGNTCYLNAVVNALAALGPFCADVGAEALGAALFCGGLPGDGVLAALRDALGALRGGGAGGPPLSRAPERVLAAAAAAGGARFRRGAQQDAHEFLLHLLERGAAEAAKAHAAGALAPAGAPPLRRTRCPVRRSFTAVLAVTITCEHCGAAAQQRELCRALPLEVPPESGAATTSPSAAAQPPLDVPALLAAFFAPERGVERACAACGHGRATLRRRLQRPPRVLLLQLKRFRAAAVAAPPGRHGELLRSSW